LSRGIDVVARQVRCRARRAASDRMLQCRPRDRAAYLDRMSSRVISPSILFTALVSLGGCAHNPTPGARTCSVLNTETQLDACVGKTVTIRGRVAGAPRVSIINVDVDAGPELFGRPAHAMGTLEKAGTQWSLKANGTLAKAHAVK
jgi:hypothetical protein